MRLSQKRTAAATGLLAVAVSCAVCVSYDHLYPSNLSPAPTARLRVLSRPLDAKIGGVHIKAQSSSADPFLNRAYEMEGVTIRTSALTIEAPSGIMVPATGALSLEDAMLRTDGLEGTIKHLVIGGSAVVLKNLQARGTIAPLAVSSFESDSIHFPEAIFRNNGVRIEKMIGGVSAAPPATREDREEIVFGFRRLELVLTILFQRAYVSGAYAHLSDGSTVRFRTGMYSARHEKIYARGASAETSDGKLTAEKAHVLMKRGQFVLLPPIRADRDGRTDILHKPVTIVLR